MRSVRVLDLLADRVAVDLLANGAGHWHTRDGSALHALDGCIDVDFVVSPFTNTLPIRRLPWEVGTSHTISVVYIVHPNLTYSAERQTYTCVRQAADHSVYEFTMRDFRQQITVDRDGLVTEYPELFSLVGARQSTG